MPYLAGAPYSHCFLLHLHGMMMGDVPSLLTSLPLTVTLCSPVPGCVNRSTCMDTSPTGSCPASGRSGNVTRTENNNMRNRVMVIIFYANRIPNNTYSK